MDVCKRYGSANITPEYNMRKIDSFAALVNTMNINSCTVHYLLTIIPFDVFINYI